MWVFSKIPFEQGEIFSFYSCCFSMRRKAKIQRLEVLEQFREVVLLSFRFEDKHAEWGKREIEGIREAMFRNRI